MGRVIKTNIKMRVTPAQSESIQKICYADGIVNSEGDKKVRDIWRAFVLVGKDVLVCTSDNNAMVNFKDFEVIDADLFIRTNGACLEKQPKQ